MPGFLQRFMPRDGDFFVLFRKQAENIVSGANAFTSMLEHYTGVPEQVQRVKAIEHQGDEITHQIFRKLNQTFITPFDREDMHELCGTMDDVRRRQPLRALSRRSRAFRHDRTHQGPCRRHRRAFLRRPCHGISRQGPAARHRNQSPGE